MYISIKFLVTLIKQAKSPTKRKKLKNCEIKYHQLLFTHHFSEMQSHLVLSEHYISTTGKVVKKYQRKYLLCADIWNYIKEFLLEDKRKFAYLYYLHKNRPFRWFGIKYHNYDEYYDDDDDIYSDCNEVWNNLINRHFGNCHALRNALVRELEKDGLTQEDLLNENLDAAKYFYALDENLYGKVVSKIAKLGNQYVNNVVRNNLLQYYHNTENKLDVKPIEKKPVAIEDYSEDEYNDIEYYDSDSY